MSSPRPFSSETNTHSTEQLLVAARKHCIEQGLKFTHLREQVFQIICESDKPIGAYEIMSALEVMSSRDHVAPPTVYRSLEFLLQYELIIRVHSLNAYLPKLHPRNNNLSALFICQLCGFSAETPNNTVQQSLNLAANELRFKVENQSLEVLGICSACCDRESGK